MNNTLRLFANTITYQDNDYIQAMPINEVYKSITGKSGTTQKKLLSDLLIESYIIVWRRHKERTKIGAIATCIMDQFRSQSQDIYISLSEVELPKDGANKANHLELLRLIQVRVQEDQKVKQPTAQSKALSQVGSTSNHSVALSSMDHIDMPLIDLEPHEQFRDANDRVFHIEVRGQRAKDKIVYNAKDVAEFMDQPNLIKTMLREHTSYQYGVDYLILQINQRGQCLLRDLVENKPEGTLIDHALVYLTTAGLIRVAAVSRNANANLIKLFDWLQMLFYTYQFGSYTERAALAQDLLKTILNDQLSGLYCIDLGCLDDLYGSMSICKQAYPPEQYGKHRIYKFGLSKDISTRLAQHQNKTSGYGRWSNQVTLKWMILLSDSQLPEAEGLLSEKFKAKGLSFEYNDESGKSHNELIMVGAKEETKVKNIYKQTLSYFPSKENGLCKLMSEMQTNHELTLLKVEHEYFQKLNAATTDTLSAQHDKQLLEAKVKAQIEMQKLTHQNEILQLKLEMAHLKLSK